MKSLKFLAFLLAIVITLTASLCCCTPNDDDGDIFGSDGASDGTTEEEEITQRENASLLCEIVTMPEVENEKLYVGQSLSEVRLVGGEGSVEGEFVWKNTATRLTERNSYELAFVPKDENYYIVYVSLTLEAEQLTLSVVAGENGVAEPVGVTDISFGDALEVIFKPDIGYAVDSVVINGESVEPTNKFSVESVCESYSVEVSFAKSELELNINCLEGSENCYTVAGSTLTFTGITEDSIYQISGQMIGNIVIDVQDELKLELEMVDFTVWSQYESPIVILGGDKVTLTAKKDSASFIYDLREAVSENDETAHSGAIYAECDLDIGGRGSLEVESENNNGIHTKDDLEVKNLALKVSCKDNALKGNDSVTVKSGKLTLIASEGDGIKTTNTDVSDKGKQRGNVELLGGEIDIYAACDGIDAALDVIVSEEAESEGTLTVNIYTDKYSEYSDEVNATSSEQRYIRFTSNAYKYSLKWQSDKGESKWVNATYHTAVDAGRQKYYYYTVPVEDGYSGFFFYMYNSSQEQGQDADYVLSSDLISWNDAYDTFALSQSGDSLRYGWANFTTSAGMGGMGGMGGGRPGAGPGGGGNTEKSDYSTKGIKAGNSITVSSGTLNIKAYDDALHASSGTALENGSYSTGAVNITGGALTLYSNDDGIHADGKLSVSGGSIDITQCYEGLEGAQVEVSGGEVSVISRDDGINSPSNEGTGVRISGGSIYIYAGGDGIDSNSRTSYSGIVFEGGRTVVVSTSGGNSAIDTERGYKYTGGEVLAVMPRGGMTNEATNAQSFSSIATKVEISVSGGSYLTVAQAGESKLALKMGSSSSVVAIYLGSNSATISTAAKAAGAFTKNGVCWY